MQFKIQIENIVIEEFNAEDSILFLDETLNIPIKIKTKKATKGLPSMALENKLVDLVAKRAELRTEIVNEEIELGNAPVELRANVVKALQARAAAERVKGIIAGCTHDKYVKRLKAITENYLMSDTYRVPENWIFENYKFLFE